ncbi:hypothetical protein VTO42DRAFT_967 [Malbranchea cinnamomea]
MRREKEVESDVGFEAECFSPEIWTLRCQNSPIRGAAKAAYLTALDKRLTTLTTMESPARRRPWNARPANKNTGVCQRKRPTVWSRSLRGVVLWRAWGIWDERVM